MCSKNAWISYMLCALLKGSSRSFISTVESSYYPFFPGIPFPGAGLATGAFIAAIFPFPPTNFYSSSLYFLVNRGSFNNSNSYEVRSSPRSFFNYKKYFLCVRFAFSALPGSLSSHDFFNSFSASSF